MNIDKAKKDILKTIKILLSEKIIENSGCLSCRVDNTMIITPKNEDLSSIDAKDLVEINLNTKIVTNNKKPTNEYKIHLAIYNEREDFSAIINSTQSSVLTSSKAGITVKPLLDDMAQIAGTSIKAVACSNGCLKKESKKMIKALKGKNAVMLKDRTMLCASSSLSDAHAVCMVMDKACKSFIETTFLGGGKKINLIEAALMRFVYLKKYSKQAESNK